MNTQDIRWIQRLENYLSYQDIGDLVGSRDTIRAIEQQIAECYLPALTSLQELLSERARRNA